MPDLVPRNGRRPLPGRKTHDPQATRAALLAAGTELFAARGFDGVTVETLARQAGVNKAMISYHFGGKEGLYAATLKENFAGLAAEVTALSRSREPADAVLRAIVARLGALMARQPNVPRMLLREVLGGGARIDDHLVELLFSVYDAVRRVLARGAREGRLRSVDPLAAHLHLFGGLAFFFGTEHFRRQAVAAGRFPAGVRPPSPERFTRYVEELLARGLASDAGVKSARR